MIFVFYFSLVKRVICLFTDDESDTATEGEEEVRARELRRQEVRLEAPELDTGSDTEVNTLLDNAGVITEPPDVVRDSRASVPDVTSTESDVVRDSRNYALDVTPVESYVFRDPRASVPDVAPIEYDVRSAGPSIPDLTTVESGIRNYTASVPDVMSTESNFATDSRTFMELESDIRNCAAFVPHMLPTESGSKNPRTVALDVALTDSESRNSKVVLPDVAATDCEDKTIFPSPVPAPRKKRNSFRITPSNLNLPQPQTDSVEKNKEFQSPSLSPARKVNSPEFNNNFDQTNLDVDPVAKRFSRLKLSDTTDKYSARKKFFEESPIKLSTLNRSNASVYEPSLSSHATSSYVPSRKMSYITQKPSVASIPDRSVKSTLASRFAYDRPYSNRRKSSYQHSRDCIVM